MRLTRAARHPFKSNLRLIMPPYLGGISSWRSPWGEPGGQ